MTAIARIPKLETPELHNVSHITGESFENCTSLKSLYLDDDNISDEILAAIPENCLEFQCLSIKSFVNEISNKGEITLSNSPKLEKLDLRIYDESVNGKIFKNL